MKKIFTLFVAVTLLILNTSAEIINGTSGELSFTLNTETGILEFAGNGAMADYADAANQPWRANLTFIKSVRFTGQPTKIGKNAFNTCVSLTSCELPSSLTSIGNRAFYGCIKLSGEFFFPSYLINIGASAFWGCSQITSVYLPASLVSIGSQAFGGCSGVTYFAVHYDNEHYVTANDVLFNKDKTILMYYPAANTRTTYTVPESVTEIGSYAFTGANNLTGITLPNGLITIGGCAFSNCSGLQEITLPASVATLGGAALADCTALTKITSLATTPPTAETAFVFQNVNTEIPVYVPKDCASAYSNAAGWSVFTNYIEFDPTAIDQTIDKSQMSNAKYINNGQLFIQQGDKIYNAQGARVE